MTKQVGVSMTVFQSTVLIAGFARGRLLQLTDNISFWGGVDPASGKIIDRRHAQYGESVVGKILAMNCSIGSSSGSSVLLELMQNKLGPRGIILAEVDLVVTLGVVVAKEMQFGNIPVVQVSKSQQYTLPEKVTINIKGEIRPWLPFKGKT